MKGMIFGHATNSVLLLLLTVWVFVILVRGVRQNPGDRVFWFEALAFMSMGLGGLISYFWQTTGLPVAVCFFILFFIFGVPAGYFAVINRVHRRKRAT